MNKLLSGTCWGERQEEEIKIAPWLTPEGRELERKIYVAEEYWEAKGRARERRKLQRKRDFRASQWQGAFVMLAIIFILALIKPM